VNILTCPVPDHVKTGIGYISLFAIMDAESDRGMDLKIGHSIPHLSGWHLLHQCVACLSDPQLISQMLIWQVRFWMYVIFYPDRINIVIHNGNGWKYFLVTDLYRPLSTNVLIELL
jgi:hypothetical protein